MVSRRAFLRRGGAAGLAGLSGLAGCALGDTPEPLLGRDAPSPGPLTTPWAAPRSDRRNTGVPGAVGPGNTPGVAWRRGVSTRPLIRAPPVAVDDDLFVLDDRRGRVSCLAVADGRTRWTASVGPVGDGVAPTVTDDRVYLAAGRTLRALTRDGDDRWRVDFPGAVRGVTVGDSLFVSTADGTPGCYAVAPDSGTVRWAVETGLVVAPAAHDGDTVVVGDMRGTVSCLDAASGETLWRRETPDAWVQAAPVVADGRVFVGTGTASLDAGHLVAYDRADGTVDWQRSLADAAAFSSFACDGSRLFAADSRGVLRRIDAASGALGWRFSPRDPFESSVSNVTPDFAPAVANGLVTYAGPDERLHVVETDAAMDGSEVGARFRGDVRATSAPTVAGSALFVGTRSGVVAVGDAAAD